MPVHLNDTELWSHEVRQILRRPPPSLIRWGTTVIVLALAIAVGVSFFVKYPSTIQSGIVLKERNAGLVKLQQFKAASIKPGQQVKVWLDLYSGQNLTFTGTVQSINPQINADGTITVMVILSDDAKLRSGMTGIAEIITGNSSIAGKLFSALL